MKLKVLARTHSHEKLHELTFVISFAGNELFEPLT